MYPSWNKAVSVTGLADAKNAHVVSGQESGEQGNVSGSREVVLGRVV